MLMPLCSWDAKRRNLKAFETSLTLKGTDDNRKEWQHGVCMISAVQGIYWHVGLPVH